MLRESLKKRPMLARPSALKRRKSWRFSALESFKSVPQTVRVRSTRSGPRERSRRANARRAEMRYKRPSWPVNKPGNLTSPEEGNSSRKKS